LSALFFKALGSPRRLMIIDLLVGGEMTVKELSGKIGASQSNISQHLSILRNVGVVKSERKERNVYYRLTDKRINKICDLACSLLKEVMSSREAAMVMKR